MTEEDGIMSGDEVMGTLLAALDSRGMRYSADEDGRTVRMVFKGDDLPINMEISVGEAVLKFRCPLDFRIATGNYEKVFWELNRINGELSFGAFCIQPDGMVDFAYGFPFLESDFSEEFLMAFIKAIAGTVDAHDGDLKRIAVSCPSGRIMYQRGGSNGQSGKEDIEAGRGRGDPQHRGHRPGSGGHRVRVQRCIGRIPRDRRGRRPPHRAVREHGSPDAPLQDAVGPRHMPGQLFRGVQAAQRDQLPDEVRDLRDRREERQGLLPLRVPLCGGQGIIRFRGAAGQVHHRGGRQPRRGAQDAGRGGDGSRRRVHARF